MEQMFAALRYFKPRLKRLADHDHISFNCRHWPSEFVFTYGSLACKQRWMNAQYPQAQMFCMTEDDYSNRAMNQTGHLQHRDLR